MPVCYVHIAKQVTRNSSNRSEERTRANCYKERAYSHRYKERALSPLQKTRALSPLQKARALSPLQTRALSITAKDARILSRKARILSRKARVFPQWRRAHEQSLPCHSFLRGNQRALPLSICMLVCLVHFDDTVDFPHEPEAGEKADGACG